MGMLTNQKQIYETDITDIKIVNGTEVYGMSIMNVKVVGTMTEELCEDP